MLSTRYAHVWLITRTLTDIITIFKLATYVNKLWEYVDRCRLLTFSHILQQKVRRTYKMCQLCSAVSVKKVRRQTWTDHLCMNCKDAATTVLSSRLICNSHR